MMIAEYSSTIRNSEILHHRIHCYRPLARACVIRSLCPRARGLTLGYMLSPAGAGLRHSFTLSQGSRTHPGLHAFARWRGLASFVHSVPGLEDSPWATCFRPLARALCSTLCRSLFTFAS